MEQGVIWKYFQIQRRTRESNGTSSTRNDPRSKNKATDKRGSETQILAQHPG
jgi:hypothetical protein